MTHLAYFRFGVLDGSSIHGSLCFKGCHVLGLEGNGMVCSGDVFLNDGFTSKRTVFLTQAQIGRSLECSNAIFNKSPADEDTDDYIYILACDSAVIGNSVKLNNGFSAKGSVSFSGTQIGGDINCVNGEFNGMANNALLCPDAVIKGSVSLNSHFIGTVCLSGAQIGFYLNCSGTTFDGVNNITFDSPNGLALRAENMTVAGIFFLKI